MAECHEMLRKLLRGWKGVIQVDISLDLEIISRINYGHLKFNFILINGINFRNGYILVKITSYGTVHIWSLNLDALV